MSEPRLTGYHIAVDDSRDPHLDGGLTPHKLAPRERRSRERAPRNARSQPEPSHTSYPRVTDTGTYRVESPSDLLSLLEETQAPQDLRGHALSDHALSDHALSDHALSGQAHPEMTTTEAEALSSIIDVTPPMDDWRSDDQIEPPDEDASKTQARTPEETLDRFARHARGWTLVSAAVMLYLAYDALTTLEPFQLREVSFQGLSHVSDEELRGLLNLEELRPSYVTPQLDQIKSAVEDHSWIKSAQASMDWLSGAITVTVTEYQPQGIITLNEIKAVTAEGVPFATVQPNELKGLPLISGIPLEIFQGSPHDQLVGQYWIASAIELSRYIQSSEILKRRALSDIHVSKTGHFEVMLDQIRVVLGSTLLRERILELERILEHLDHKGVSAAYILLSDDLKRAIVKEIPIQAASAQPR